MVFPENHRPEFDRPDRSVGRAPTLGAGGHGFKSGPHHSKGVKKNVTSSTLADTCIKRGCARKIKAGMYLLKDIIMPQ